MEIQTKGAVMSPRYPQSLLTPVPPCSWTYVGDVLFICCTVLGRQTLRETKEEVSVGTPPGGGQALTANHHYSSRSPCTLGLQKPLGSENHAPGFLLKCSESFSSHPVLRLLFFTSPQTRAPESGPSSVQTSPMTTPLPQSLASARTPQYQTWSH